MSLVAIQNMGLSQNESILYELLLKHGEVPITELIRQSHLKRPTVYKAVHSLTQKGLAHQRDVRKKLHVIPESPMKLQELAEKEYQKVEAAKVNLSALLPSLALLYTHSTQKPVVRVYEGVAGLKKIYLDFLEVGKPLYALLQAASIEPELYQWLTTTYIRKRVRAKIHANVIVASSSASHEYIQKSKKEYRITRRVDAKRFPFQHEIDIYGDKVAIIHYKKDEPLIGIVISHPQIAITMKAWFDLAWEASES